MTQVVIHIFAIGILSGILLMIIAAWERFEKRLTKKGISVVLYQVVLMLVSLVIVITIAREAYTFLAITF